MNTIPKTYKRNYNDSINDCFIEFRTDAPQSTINALEFAGEWYEIREILRISGYTVIENQLNN